MKNVIVLSLISFAIVGCVSSSYKLSVPPVEVKGNAKYRVINYYENRYMHPNALVGIASGESAHDVLYNDGSEIIVMPIGIRCYEYEREREISSNTLLAILSYSTLGIVPNHSSIRAYYYVAVDGPQGLSNGQFEIVKDSWGGWFAPLLVPDWDTHADDEGLYTYNPGDLVGIGVVRKTLELASELDYDAYVAEQKRARIEELSSANDEAMLESIVKNEKEDDIRAVAEQRLKEIAEKTALEKIHRKEVNAQVAMHKENHEWDSIITLCEKEISNAEFLGANELMDMKVAAERSKELDRIAEVKKAIDEKSKAEEWDDVIAICKKELLTAPSRPGHLIEDSGFWVSTRDDARAARFCKIKAEVDGLCENGQWSIAIGRCEAELAKPMKPLFAGGWSEKELKYFSSIVDDAVRQKELARICSVTNSLQEKLDKKMWSDVMKVCGDELREIGTGRGRSQEDLLVWEHFKKLAIDGERVQRDARLTSMGLRFNGESLLSVCTTPSKLKINDVYVNDSSEFRIAQFMLDEHNARVRVPDNYSYILVKTIDAYADDDRLEPDTWFAYKGLRQYKTIFGAPVTIRYFEQVSKQ